MTSLPSAQETVDGLRAKRARTSSPEPPVEVVRSGIWFDDGNVILEAASTQFRVHRGVLSANSRVFADMFGVTELLAGESVDGCPVVPCHDSAEDITCMLKCLYDRRFFRPGKEQEALTAISVLRLATKYQLDALREEAIDILVSEFPSDLEAYHDLTRKKQPTFKDLTKPNLLMLANAALAADARIVLPLLYYRLVTTCTLTDLIHGISSSKGRTERLALRAQQSCILGRESLAELSTTASHSWITKGPSEACISRQDCKRALNGLLASYLQATVGGRINNLRPWSAFSRRLDGVICPKCMEAAKKSYESAQADAFNKLPSFFEMGTWDQLREA